MNKRIGLDWFKFLDFKRFKNVKSITLVELLISIVVVAIMVLSFHSLETFSLQQVMSADRRAKVQNNLAYCLEHMSKYVHQANGDKVNPPIKLYPNAVTPTGFQVRFDCKALQTPVDLTDDVWIYYALSGNTLSVGCKNNLGVDCPPGSCVARRLVSAEDLSNKIFAGFSNNAVLPSPVPDPPTAGFYVKIDPLGNFVDVGLIGRYDPTKPVSRGTVGFVNPQVEMKTRLICNNSPTN